MSKKTNNKKNEEDDYKENGKDVYDNIENNKKSNEKSNEEANEDSNLEKVNNPDNPKEYNNKKIDKNKKSRQSTSQSNSKKTKSKKKQRKNKTKQGGSALRKIYLRNIFLYSQYRKINVLLALSLSSMIISVLLFYHFATKTVPPRYIPLNTNNTVLAKQSVKSAKGYPNSKVLRFSVKAFKSINSYDYINYKYQLQKTMHYFSHRGWENFLNKFYSSKNLNTVKKKHLVVTLKPRGTPSVAKKGLVGKSYKWLIKMPVSVQYYHNGNITNTQTGKIISLITRTQKTNRRAGLMIQTYNLKIKNN